MEKIKEIINIRHEINFYKKVSIISLSFSVLSMIIYSVFSYIMFVSYQESIYVLDADGKAFQANLEGGPRTRTEPEAYDHVVTFHNLFYQIDPFNYNARLSKALDLIGESGKDLYLNFKGQGWYAGLSNNNYRQSILIDSISINMNVYPYKGYVDFRLVIQPYDQRDTRKMREFRYIAKDFDLLTVDRSRKNAHGLVIENYTVERK